METEMEDSYNQWFLGVMKHTIKVMLIIQIHTWQQSIMHHLTTVNDKILGVNNALHTAEIQWRVVWSEVGVHTTNNTTVKGMEIFVFFGNIQKNVGYQKNSSNFCKYFLCFSYISNNNLKHILHLHNTYLYIHPHRHTHAHTLSLILECASSLSFKFWAQLKQQHLEQVL